MNGAGRRALGLAALAAVGLAACATTRLTSVWRDETYRGPQLRKVLVVGVSERAVIRRLFEDEFTRQLKARGSDATPSYTIGSLELLQDRAASVAKIRELGFDGVLVTRLVDRKTVTTYYPPTYLGPPGYAGGWYGYYSLSYGYVTSPGYTVESQVVNLETSVYETKADRLVWSALSETFLEGSSQSLVRSLIKLLVANLAKAGLV